MWARLCARLLRYSCFTSSSSPESSSESPELDDMENVRPSILLGILFGGACPATKSGISMPACDDDEGAPCPFKSSSSILPLALHNSTNKTFIPSFKHLSSYRPSTLLSPLLWISRLKWARPVSCCCCRFPKTFSQKSSISSREEFRWRRRGSHQRTAQRFGQGPFEKELEVGREQRRRLRRGRSIEIEDRRVFCLES